VNFSKFEKGGSFENIIEKLIHAKFQLFKTFSTFFQQNNKKFQVQETTPANLKKNLNLSMQFHI
jgi:hypothetical protein